MAPAAPGLEDFTALAASFFLDAQKEAKEAPGGSHRSNFGLSASFSMLSPPLDPLFYGGCQLGGMAGQRKGAGGVGIDTVSPTAAAAWVGFSVWWFLCLQARLCVGWGTSRAVVEGW